MLLQVFFASEGSKSFLYDMPCVFLLMKHNARRLDMVIEKYDVA